MAEENEIRVGLSYYERGRIVARAAEQGVYRDTAVALAALFASASRSKRSKIGSFLKLYKALEDRLIFASAIPERLGLRLVKTLEADTDLVNRLRERLRKTPCSTAVEEIAALESALKVQQKKRSPKGKLSTILALKLLEYREAEITPGIQLQACDGVLVLSGAGIEGSFRAELENWLLRR